MSDFTCGGQPPAPPVSVFGAGNSSVPFFLTGADPDLGGTANQVIDMTTEAGDYAPDPIFEFMICIETAAVIEVQLANGDDFTITAAQATAYLGQFIPYKLKLVYKAGTTGTFSTGR